MTPSTIYCWEDEQTSVAMAHAYRILLVVTEEPQEQYLREYADALARPQCGEAKHGTPEPRDTRG